MAKMGFKKFSQALHSAGFGKQTEWHATIPSTNTRCKELARAGAPEGTVVVALAQTAGRGRRGRRFHSPAGGIYLSVLLRPSGPVDPGLITCCGAVAALRAVCRLCDAPVGIKWVNDLILNGRKFCGILAEGEPAPTGGLSYVVLGFGINVAAADFPPELAAIATSLANEGYAVEREALLTALLEELEAVYALPPATMLAEYRRHCLVLGRGVTVYRGNETFAATARAVTEDGGLAVDTEQGETVILRSGEVSLRW